MIPFHVELDERFWVPVMNRSDYSSLERRVDKPTYADRNFMGFIIIGADAYEGDIYLRSTALTATISIFTVSKAVLASVFYSRTVDEVISGPERSLFYFDSSVASTCEIIGIFA